MKNILSKITTLSATNKTSMKEIQTDNTNKVNTVTISKIYTVKNTKTNKVFINKNMIKPLKVSTNLKNKTQNKTVSSTLSTTLILQIMKSSSFNKLKTNPILSFKTPLFLKLLNIKVSTLIQFSHLLMNLLPNSLIIEFRNQSQ